MAYIRLIILLKIEQRGHLCQGFLRHNETVFTGPDLERSKLIMMIVSLFKSSIMVLEIAMASMYLGLIVERWYFFAEGNHPQNIYYQTIA